MTCEKCAKDTARRRTVATIFHFIMKLCPVCAEKYGARDEHGKIIYLEDKHEQ